MDEYRMIDGKDVYSFLSAFTTIFKKALYFLTGAVRRHMLLFIVTFGLVSAAGVVYWYKKQPFYEAKMTCLYNTLNRRTYGQMVQKLDLLVQSQSYTSLSQILHMPVELCSHISGIDGRNEAGSLLYEDPTEDQGPMYFTVRATDTRVFMPLQQALLDYMNTGNPFRAKRDTFEVEFIDHTLIITKKNIETIDSVINAYTAYYRNPASSTDTLLTSKNIIGLLDYRKDQWNKIKELEFRKESIKHWTELYSGFVPPANASKNTLKILGLTAVLAFLVSAFVAMFAYASGNVKKQQGHG